VCEIPLRRVTAALDAAARDLGIRWSDYMTVETR
jgi:hypothetical protein